MRWSSSGPYRCTQRHTVVWSTSRQRSSSNSSTSRNESEYRRYQRTAHRMSWGSVCRHLKIAGLFSIWPLQATSAGEFETCNTTVRFDVHPAAADQWIELLDRTRTTHKNSPPELQ